MLLLITKWLIQAAWDKTSSWKHLMGAFHDEIVLIKVLNANTMKLLRAKNQLQIVNWLLTRSQLPRVG